MIIIENDNLDEINGDTCFHLFYFTASWCGPCQKIKPIIDAISNSVSEDKLKICKIDVGDNTEIVEKYTVESIPALILFKNNEQIVRYSGSDKNKIADIFKHVK